MAIRACEQDLHSQVRMASIQPQTNADVHR